MKSAVETARERLRAAGLRPAVVAHDAWGASGLEVVLPETVLLCLQASDAVAVLRGRGIDIFCLAEHADPATLAGGSSLELLEHRATRAYCSALPPLALLAFKPTERLVAAARALGATLISAPPAAARAAENKLAFIELAAAAGVPTPRWGAVTRGAAHFPALAREWGVPFVLQAPRGNAGQRTWLVTGEADLQRALAADPAERLRVAEWVEGLPFTATGLASPGGELLGRIEPCRQLTGVAWLTPEPLGSCGNSWPEAALAEAAPAVDRILQALARQLAAGGYHGIFGVDFVLADGGPRVIEVNPRMVASLPLATQMEAAAGRAPILLRRLLAGLDATAPVPRDEQPLPAATQLVVHDPGGGAAAPAFPSGVYRLGAGGPERLRDGAWLGDLQADDEALLLTRAAGEPVSPGREFARLYLRRADGDAAPGARALVDALRGGTATR